MFISEKYSVYDIQVTARTRIGEGPKSDSITARTNEDRKSYFSVIKRLLNIRDKEPALYQPKYFLFMFLVPNVAHNLTARSTSSETLLVTWSPPSDPNGVITGYKLTWQMKENDKRKEIDNAPINETNLGPVQQHTIIGLC